MLSIYVIGMCINAHHTEIPRISEILQQPQQSICILVIELYVWMTAVLSAVFHVIRINLWIKANVDEEYEQVCNRKMHRFGKLWLANC